MAEYIKGVYTKMNKLIFYACLSISIFLSVFSFFAPPKGEISPSVIAAMGEFFLWPVLGTVLVAVEKGSDIKVQKGDTTVHIDNPDKVNKENYNLNLDEYDQDNQDS